MAERNIFAEEWRRCLREHYKYVIAEGDHITERTLVGVLHRVGFTDDELRQLYMEATLRAEDVPDNFMPDMQKLPYQAHPAECTCAACMDQVLDIGHDHEGQPLSPEAAALQNAEPVGNIFAAAKPNMDDDDKPGGNLPRQLTLF